MNKKYSQRTLPIVTRDSYLNNREVSSLEAEFSKQMEKISVEPFKNDSTSIYDQISSIMGYKSKYPTVEAAVEDMKERSGLTAYLKQIQSSGLTVSNSKIAGDSKQIALFDKIPSVKNTIDNYIEDTFGNISLPAIIEKIRGIYLNEVTESADWDDENLLRYINTKNTEVKKRYPGSDSHNSSLGKLPMDEMDLDSNQSDMFDGLNPVKF